MNTVVKIRASRKEKSPRAIRAPRVIGAYEKSLIERAAKLLKDGKPRTFEDIHRLLAPLRSEKAKQLRREIANFFG